MSVHNPVHKICGQLLNLYLSTIYTQVMHNCTGQLCTDLHVYEKQI